MPSPLVSVLLPVRDAGPHLAGCIASLEHQSLSDFEVVAVDDGSVDGSGGALDAWARRDPRVAVLHRPAEGLVAALDAGLARCRAPLVARMDADDVCHPRRLELQAGLLAAQPEIGVASCLVRHVPWSGVGEGFRVYEAWLNSLTTPAAIARERFVESPVAHPSAVVRRELYEGCGGYRDFDGPEDYDLWLRLLEAGVQIAKVERHLYFWREHGDRLTRTDGRYSVENFLRVKARYLFSGPLAGAVPAVVWGAGQTGRRLSKHLLRGGAAIRAFVDIDPAKIGRSLRGRPVVGPGELASLLAGGAVVLAAVASRGARAIIRDHLSGLGLVEGEGYWCVA
jgi:glycosyltransferase involved in cell wall biosynthesis